MGRVLLYLLSAAIIAFTLLSFPRLYNTLYRIDWSKGAEGASALPRTVKPTIIKGEQKQTFRFYTGQKSIPVNKILKKKAPSPATQ